MSLFSERSKSKLATCHPDLQELFNEVIKHFDCTILAGHRDEEAQNGAYNAGMSKLKWPDSTHNEVPSMAVDAAPYPVRWPDKIQDPKKRKAEWHRWYMFVGFVRGVAAARGIEIRTGADWDGDYEVSDQTFHDLPHFELVLHGGTY